MKLLGYVLLGLGLFFAGVYGLADAKWGHLKAPTPEEAPMWTTIDATRSVAYPLAGVVAAIGGALVVAGHLRRRQDVLANEPHDWSSSR